MTITVEQALRNSPIVDKLDELCKTYEVKLSNLERELAEAKAELATAEAELAEAVRRYERAELACDYKRLNELEAELELYKEDVHKTNNIALDYARERDDVKAELATAESAVKDLMEANEKLQAELAKLGEVKQIVMQICELVDAGSNPVLARIKVAEMKAELAKVREENEFFKKAMVRISSAFDITSPLELIAMAKDNSQDYVDCLILAIKNRIKRIEAVGK